MRKGLNVYEILDFYKSAFFSTYFLFTFYAFAIQNFSLMLVWLLGTFFGVTIALYRQSNKKYNFDKNIASYSLAILGSCVLVLSFSLYKNFFNVGYLFCIFFSIVVSYLISERLKILYYAFRVTLVFVQIFLVGYILKNNIKDPLSFLIDGASGNGITSYLIVLQSCYNVIFFLQKKKIPWETNLVTLYICVVGIGRGSLLASLFLNGINFLFFINEFLLKNKKSKFLVLALLCTFVVTVFALSGKIYYYYSTTKLVVGFFDQLRSWMWNDYFHSLNFFEIIIGKKFDNLIIGEFFRGNPHNSFIRAHSKFGLLYSFLIIIGPLIFLIKSKLSKASFYIFFVFSIIFFRATTETILFPTAMDIFYFSALFSALRILNLGEHDVEKCI